MNEDVFDDWKNEDDFDDADLMNEMEMSFDEECCRSSFHSKVVKEFQVRKKRSFCISSHI